MPAVRFRKTPVPERVTPLVRRLFDEMNNQQCSDQMMASRAGVGRYTLSDWRHKTVPNVLNLEACLNVLGLELVVRRKKDASE